MENKRMEQLKIGDIILKNKIIISRENYNQAFPKGISPLIKGIFLGEIKLNSDTDEKVKLYLNVSDYFNKSMDAKELKNLKLSLPSIEMLKAIYKSRKAFQIDDIKFKKSWYWSSSQAAKNEYYIFNFGNGKTSVAKTDKKYYVMTVWKL